MDITRRKGHERGKEENERGKGHRGNKYDDHSERWEGPSVTLQSSPEAGNWDEGKLTTV
jgi:hypothetical protein